MKEYFYQRTVQKYDIPYVNIKTVGRQLEGNILIHAVVAVVD